MAVPTQVTTFNPFYSTMSGSDIDAGDYDITMSSNQVNFDKGFTIQTGTLTAMTVHVLDSVDGLVFVDSTIDYLPAAAAISNQAYKCELHAPVRFIRIRATRSNATNAVDIKVLAPSR